VCVHAHQRGTPSADFRRYAACGAFPLGPDPRSMLCAMRTSIAKFGQNAPSVGSRARMHGVMPEETSEHGSRRGTHQWGVGRSTCGARAAERAKSAMRQRPFSALLMAWLYKHGARTHDPSLCHDAPVDQAGAHLDRVPTVCRHTADRCAGACR